MWGSHYNTNNNHSYHPPPPHHPSHHYYNNYPCIPPPPPPPWHSCQCRHAPYYSPTSHFNYNNHSEYSNYSRGYPTTSYDNYNMYNYTQPETHNEQMNMNNNEVKPRSRKITKNKKNIPPNDNNAYHQYTNQDFTPIQIYHKSEPNTEQDQGMHASLLFLTYTFLMFLY